jgi:hypothetical protein
MQVTIYKKEDAGDTMKDFNDWLNEEMSPQIGGQYGNVNQPGLVQQRMGYLSGALDQTTLNRRRWVHLLLSQIQQIPEEERLLVLRIAMQQLRKGAVQPQMAQTPSPQMAQTPSPQIPPE